MLQRYRILNTFVAKTIYKSVLSHLKMPFYAVARGKTPGIFMTWPDCESQVKGFSGAKYKKFNTVNEAQEYINQHSDAGSSSKPPNYSNKPTTNPTNLKRSYSTSTTLATAINPQKGTKNPVKQRQNNLDSEDDDLDTMVIKQMDDIEKRLNGVKKNVDNIIKKSAKNYKSTMLIEPPYPKKPKQNENWFEIDKLGFVHVYTDGACSANGHKSAKAGLGVFWGNDHPLNVSEPVAGRATNNCGEIQAAIKAIKIALQNNIGQLQINTDSKFLINSVTKWMPGKKLLLYY